MPGAAAQALYTSAVYPGALPAPSVPAAWVPPSSSEWTAASAAIEAMGAGPAGIVLVAEATGLRSNVDGGDGVTNGSSVGGAVNWLRPGEFATASGDQRPGYVANVAGTGVAGIDFDGVLSDPDNDRLAPPFHITWGVGSFAFVIYQDDDSSRGTVNQTLLQTKLFRVVTRVSDANPVPAVRVSGNVYHEFPASASIYQEWTLLEGEWNELAGTLRLRRDGQEWVEISVALWMNNGSSLIARSSFEDAGSSNYGAPFPGAVHKAMLFDKIPSFAQWADIRPFALVDSGISDDGPTAPTTPSDEVIPDPLSIVAAANTAELASALSGAPAGRHVVLTGAGPYTWPTTIAASGTDEAPIVVRPQVIHEPVVNGNVSVTGSNVWIVALSLREQVQLIGGNNRVVRNYFRTRTTSGQYIEDRGPNNVFAYNETQSLSGSTGLAFIDVRPRDGAIGFHIHHNFLKNWRRLPIKIGNQAEDSRVLTGGLIEYNLMDGQNSVPNNSDAGYHAIELKTSRVTVQFNSVINCTSGKGSLSIRHGTENVFQHNKCTGGAGIYMADRDNSAYNNDVPKIRVSYGNQPAIDGSIIFDGGNYIQSLRNWIAWNTAVVNVGDSFGTYVYPADDTRIRDHRSGPSTINLVSGRQINTTQAPPPASPFPASPAAPEVVTEEMVGPNATGVGYILPGEFQATPFNAQSAMYRPIGSGATYASDAHASRVAWVAVVPSNNGQGGGGTIGAINQGNPFGVASMHGKLSDPLRTLEKRNCTDTGTGSGNWDGGGTSASIRIPTTNGINTSSGNQCYENTAFIVQEDYSTAETFQTNNRGSNRYTASILRLGSVRGLGHGSALGDRVGVSASGASVRMGMLSVAGLLAEEEIGHALTLAIYSGTGSQSYELLSRDIRWPACNGDSFAHLAANNNGAIPYGAHLAIKPSLDLSTIGLTTPQGYILGRAMRDYGVYCMDDGDGIIIRADGSLGANATAIVADYRKLLYHLYMILDSVENGTAAVAEGASYSHSGDIGDPTWPAGGGTALAPNTALAA